MYDVNQLRGLPLIPSPLSLQSSRSGSTVSKAALRSKAMIPKILPVCFASVHMACAVAMAEVVDPDIPKAGAVISLHC